jgi:hypothetical protein
MSPNQFIHLTAYGRASKRHGPKWANISGILAEAARLPGAVGHLSNPAPPTILFGSAPQQLIEPATSLSLMAVDAKGRRLRCEGGVLVAGVATYPSPQSLFDQDVTEFDLYALWRQSTLAWLQKIFDRNLKSVVEHVDENQRHLHFFVLPRLASTDCINWTSAHPGILAKRNAESAGQDKREQESCYREAMRTFQDQFFHEVSEFFRHARFGPKRERVSRMEYQALTKIETLRSEEADIRARAANLRAEQNSQERIRLEAGPARSDTEQIRQLLSVAEERATRAEEENALLREQIRASQNSEGLAYKP